MRNEGEVRFTEHSDSAIIADFPPRFLQKGFEHIKNHFDEQFVLQTTGTRIFMRRMKKTLDGERPKDSINGRIIT
ncbi:hypothetical protein HY405_00060 [Candidatus Microgenomates bacterium]|nr:hypothetical protein [Candidatus Microgenomates bacterium]